MTWIKPIPVVEKAMKPFWEGLKNHRFLLLRCNECGAWYWPATYCRHHKNKPFFGSLAWTDASGRGKIISFNITRVAMRPAFKDETPYVYALIQLNEGPIMSSNIVNCPADSVHIDMPVRIVFRDVPEINLTIPYFEPA
jgi:uncharacterized protein